MSKLLKKLGVLVLCVALVMGDNAISGFAAEVQEQPNVISEIPGKISEVEEETAEAEESLEEVAEETEPEKEEVTEETEPEEEEAAEEVEPEEEEAAEEAEPEEEEKTEVLESEKETISNEGNSFEEMSDNIDEAEEIVTESLNATSYELRYSLSDGEATITGLGWYDSEDSRDLVIPGTIDGYPVVGIADNAFYNKNFTGNLIIQNGVKTIGDYAFSNCSGFTGSLTIPDSVESIGQNAFSNCKGFDGNLILSKNLKDIGNNAFWVCSGFTGSLTIPDSVESIGRNAFSVCKGFDGNLKLSKNLKYIGDAAFQQCEGFTGSLTIPGGVTNIGDRAFNSCENFDGNLTIQEGVERIGVHAFGYCVFNGALTLPSSIKNIESYAFYGCKGLKGNLVIPEKVTSIGEYAFHGCGGFKGDVTLPNGIITIGTAAFYECTNGYEGSLTIPSSVTSIGEDVVTFSGFNQVINNSSVALSFNKYWDGAWYKSNERIYSLASGTATRRCIKGDGPCSGGKASCIVRARCSKCGEEYGPYSFSNHIEVVYKNRVEATCISNGYSGEAYCTVCDVKFSNGEIIEKTAHTPSVPVKENVVQPTCNETGSYDNVTYCAFEKCKAEVSRNKIFTDKLEHVDKDGDLLCDLCNKKIFEDGFLIKDIEDQVYTGKAISPKITVYDRNKKLVLNQDYVVRITKNVNVGKAIVTITGKGNYEKVETAEFNILPLNIDESSLVSDEMAIKATGSDQKPKPVLTWNGKAVATTGYSYQYFKADESGNPTGEALPAVKDAGNYVIVITGKGNFDKSRNVKLTVVDDQKLASKLTVVKIPAQPYTGTGIEPVLTVKDGKTDLIKNKDYTVEYFNNTKVGTAYAVVTGIGNYSGSKRVSFKITGTAITKATVEGLPALVTYTGNDIIFDNLKLYIKATSNTDQINLKKDIDYEVSYINNNKVGSATVVFTGINGYTGVLKKTFKITAFKMSDDSERVSVVMSESVEYSKGGAKPAVTVTFTNGDGVVKTLTEKTDYIVAYANNKVITTSSTVKIPTVKVTLKGNFSGVITKNFSIIPKNLGEVTVVAADKVYTGKPNNWKSVVVVTDTDGKKLVANTDYESVIEYTYAESGETVQTSDEVNTDTVIKATVKAKLGGNYTGTTSCTYRIVQASINTAKVIIESQTYSGKAIELDASSMEVKVGTASLEAGTDYEIVPNSYSNNVNKGTASVTIRGINNYGGTKKANFKIRAKGFTWWWR